jgi:uncharacterized protein
MKTNKAWKEPMIWLIFGIPFLTVVAGFYTLKIAGAANATDVVNMPVSRIAQIQQSDLAADEAAARLNMRGQLQVLDNRWTISGISIKNKEPLQLDLQHPIDQKKDRQIVLQWHNGQYVAHADVNRKHDWVLQLSNKNIDWRLVGRLHKQADSTPLQASLATP